MKVTVHHDDFSFSLPTRRLLRRMLSPLCGLDQSISFLLRGRYGPRFTVAGAELTGVHVLRGQPKPPGVAPYHIGGTGFFVEEALIRSLGETIERYSQFVSEVSRGRQIIVAKWADVVNGGERAVPHDKLVFFSKDQYCRPNFPFKPFSPDVPLGWVKVFSLIDNNPLWVPAQLILVGYLAKSHEGESRISAAVTTGTAAHTRPELALRNALLELVQIDSAIGHWYSDQVARQILHDERTAAIQRLIESQFSAYGPMLDFYWLPSPDLPGISVACRIKERQGNVPAVSIGLGIDLDLRSAMYKALLEAVGVFGLSKFNLLDISSDNLLKEWTDVHLDPHSIFDLDCNVAYYALPENTAFIDAKFSDEHGVPANDIPPDVSTTPCDDIRLLIRAFQESNKELVFLDLTTDDIRDLGFASLRVWSPDTLSLPLPSAPALNHPRFVAYGGAAHENPHPYP